MKRSDTMLKIASAAIFLALLCYIGLYAYDALANPFATYAAAAYTVSDSGDSHGWAVRSEQPIHAAGYVSVEADSGLRVASGELIARIYQDEQSLTRADEIYRLTLEIKHMEELLESDGDVRADMLEGILALASAAATPDLSGLDDALSQVDSAIYGAAETDKEAIASQLELRRLRLASLTGMQRGVTNVTAEASGLFSTTADGFEHVTPAMLDGVSPETLDDLFTEQTPYSAVIGKLISGTTWYYAGIMTTVDAAKLPVGKTVSLSFYDTCTEVLDMTVERVLRRTGEDTCVVIFSSNRYMAETCSLRRLSASVLFSQQEGLRVPKQALHLNEEGGTHVFVVSGIQAKRVDVKIIAELDGYYVITADSGLYDGVEVITRCNDLYDGKVVG